MRPGRGRGQESQCLVQRHIVSTVASLCVSDFRRYIWTSKVPLRSAHSLEYASASVRPKDLSRSARPGVRHGFVSVIWR